MTDTALKNEGLAARLDRLVSPFYDRDGITIYNADCRDVLPMLGKFDLLLTDPPYGIGEAAKRHATRQSSQRCPNGPPGPPREYKRYKWDDEPADADRIGVSRDAAERQIVFGGNYFTLPPSSCWLVWDKDNTGDFADCELAWTNMTRAVRKFKWRWNGMLQEQMGDKKERRVHPTQKPLALMKWCIGLVPEAKSVLDPFMGSGTTLVAAKQLGLRAVGIEINREYCEAAVERLRQGVLCFDSEG